MVGASQSGPETGNIGQPMFVLQDRYEVVSILGQGGMGTVYVARDRRLSLRHCVVKKLRDDFFRQEDKEKAMAFFDREVNVLSRLQHANIVRILDSFKENQDCYLVMEYVEGENLHQMLHRRGEPFSEEQVLVWASQIAEVLDYLHTQDPQIIYRDLKPSNIMIDTKDCVKLVDFGIARPYVEESDNTHVVSAGYSPPEQYWGGADPRSDIYALGATIYFLLTGEEPLALQTSSPRRVNLEVTEHTDAMVQRATSQDLNLRYQGALDMKDDLEYFKSGAMAGGRATKTAIISVLAILGIILLGVGGTYMSVLIRKPLETQVESYRQQVRLMEEQSKRQAQAKTAPVRQFKQTDEIVEKHPAPLAKGALLQAPDPTKPKPATVAFREVDEAQLTDPEDLVLPGKGQSTETVPDANDQNESNSDQSD